MAKLKLTKKSMSIIVAAVFGVIGVGTVITSFAATQTVWQTGFENGDRNPDYSDAIDWATNIGPYNPGGKPEASIRSEVAHSGTRALMYSGNDLSSGGSYVYFKSFDVEIPITNDTSFSYYMYPQNTNGECVAIDMQFSDGSTLRDSGGKDTNGVSVHPNQCHGKKMALNQWNKVESKIGDYMAGKTVKRIWVAYDQPENTGQFRGYIDDLSFFTSTPIIPATVTDSYTAKYWNYSVNPEIPTRTPDVTTQEQAISHNWGGGKPFDKINNDKFVAQWQKVQDFQQGQYVFQVASDDGVRVYLDNEAIVNQWVDRSYTTTSVTKTVSAGKHTIRVEYYENSGDARIDFSIQKTLVPQPTTQATPTAPVIVTPPAPSPVATNSAQYPLAGVKLFNDTVNDAATNQVNQLAGSNPTAANLIRKIANQPRGKWLGGWSGDIKSAANDTSTRAAAQKAVPVYVAYNIPFRDCGQYSAGGLSSGAEYGQWISNMAAGINGRKAVVILEPDALGLMNCLSDNDKSQRLAMLANAVNVLKASGALVYIEASTWIDPSSMAGYLQQANVASAAGFALNVSGFNSTSDMTNYGNAVSSKIGGKHFVIDTSRNGNGGNGEWCNPSGRALGNPPQTFNTGNVDAYLWIKAPGESDGTCNGGPDAGQWWLDYATGLASRSQF